MKASEWSLLLLLSLLWGGTFLFVGVAVQELPPLTIVLTRVGLAALFFHIILFVIKKQMPLDWTMIRAFFIMALLNNVIPFSLIAWGQSQIASGLASILNATTPMFTVIVAHFLTRDEKFNMLKVIGISIGFFGIVMMMGTDLLTALDTNIIAQLAILGAALSYGFALTFGKKFKRMNISPLHVATGQVSASTIIMVPMVMVIDLPNLHAIPSFATIMSLVGLAGLSTVMAYIIFFRILESSGAINLSLVTVLIPPIAIILGVMFLGEVLELNQLLGMSFVAFGLLLLDGRIIRRIRHK